MLIDVVFLTIAYIYFKIDIPTMYSEIKCKNASNEKFMRITPELIEDKLTYTREVTFGSIIQRCVSFFYDSSFPIPKYLQKFIQ